jgi:hypothetical protein
VKPSGPGAFVDPILESASKISCSEGISHRMRLSSGKIQLSKFGKESFGVRLYSLKMYVSRFQDFRISQFGQLLGFPRYLLLSLSPVIQIIDVCPLCLFLI